MDPLPFIDAIDSVPRKAKDRADPPVDQSFHKKICNGMGHEFSSSPSDVRANESRDSRTPDIAHRIGPRVGSLQFGSLLDVCVAFVPVKPGE